MGTDCSLIPAGQPSPFGRDLVLLPLDFELPDEDERLPLDALPEEDRLPLDERLAVARLRELGADEPALAEEDRDVEPERLPTLPRVLLEPEWAPARLDPDEYRPVEVTPSITRRAGEEELDPTEPPYRL